MTTCGFSDRDVAVRARAWHHRAQAAVCDVIEPWAHGTVVRATRQPSYYDFNLVRVEEDPRMSVGELMAFADQALAGLAHRRVDVELVDVADELRPNFEAAGWKALRLLWMHSDEGRPSRARDGDFEQVAYDVVQDLRIAWYREDFPDQDPGAYHAHAREVAMRRGAQVLMAREGDVPVAFAQLQRDATVAKITAVYVDPGHRARGLGTALTRAAIAVAGEARDLWICADDEDRPKNLYAQLGFRPVWTMMEFTRWP